MHDEGSLRTVSAEACRSGDRQGNDYLFVLESGPAHGPRRFPESRYPSQTEHSSGKACEFVLGLFIEGTVEAVYGRIGGHRPPLQFMIFPPPGIPGGFERRVAS